MKDGVQEAFTDAKLLRAALDSSDNGIIIYDCLRDDQGTLVDFRVVLVNQKAQQLANRPADQLIGQTARALFPRTFETDFWQHVSAVASTGEARTVESRQTLNSGYQGYFQITITRYGDGVITSFADITDLRQTAIRAQQQSELLDSVVNGAINGMIVYESVRNQTGEIIDLRIKLANEAAAGITGVSVAQMIGNTMVNQYPTAHESGLFAKYVHTIETGQPQRLESHYTYDGLDGWFDIAVSKLGDGMLMTFMDITATKLYQQELQKSILELQRSNKNLEQFAYVASHDLQEPLRKITSFGDMLQRQHADGVSTDAAALISRMQGAAGRMNTLAQDLLTFSRLSSRKEPFRRVNLQTVVDDVLSDLETVIRDKKAVLDVTALPYVTGDPMQLRQLFQNLLSNALKFVQPGDIPLIRVECQQIRGGEIVPLPGLTVPLSDLSRQFFAITIVDNGIGFDEKYLDRIFTLFQRLHTRSEYQGTGIGLAIVQKVVENHKGYLNAQSRPEQGAAFTVYLPDEPAPLAISL